jgi:adenine-specific DNA-methyltransferase
MSRKLELVWPGKEDDYAIVRDEETGNARRVHYADVQPRLLIEKQRYGDADRGTENVLISGDNLYALKTLLASGYAESVKLVYIDPPYNTGNAFAYYDDGLEHSIWLTMMRDRLELLKALMAREGSIWVQLDDNEVHYCRVLMDEIFGRRNFVTNIVWKKLFAPNNTAKYFSANHDHILVYARNKDLWTRNLLPRQQAHNASYTNPDNDPRGAWTSSDLSARNYYSLGTYAVTSPSGRVITGPPKGRFWSISKEAFEELDADNRIWWGEDGGNVPRLKKFLSEVKKGIVPQTIWSHEEVGNTQEAKKEVIALFPEEDDVFDTAKPERLMKRIIEIGSNPGDLVLDCFLGTATTAAVAHKMERQWIGVEAGEHAETLCLSRLRKVVDGSDVGGISPLVLPHPSRTPQTQTDLFGEPVDSLPVGWTGGGGFTYYILGKALMERDAEIGVWRLNYDNGLLIEAVCLQEGFRLCADGARHGVKGRHYAHITEQYITQDYVDMLATELDEGEDFTLYCMKHADNLQLPETIEIKRIPRDLLKEPAK